MIKLQQHLKRLTMQQGLSVAMRMSVQKKKHNELRKEFFQKLPTQRPILSPFSAQNIEDFESYQNFFKYHEADKNPIQQHFAKIERTKLKKRHHNYNSQGQLLDA